MAVETLNAETVDSRRAFAAVICEVDQSVSVLETQTQQLRAGADCSMALNKKHKKQLEVIRKKLPQLKQQLAGEKEQMDDPAAIQWIEAEIAKLEEQRKTIESEK
jgi:cob(I)alamin adenosyltransferase